MKKLLIIVLLFAMLLSFAKASYAVEFNVGSTFGTLYFSDNGDGSHKAMLGFVADATWAEKRFTKTLEFKYLTRAEPRDEDDRSLSHIIGLLGKVSYDYDFFSCADTKIYPFLGLGVQQFGRSSPKTEGTPWGDLLFYEAIAGLGLKHKDIIIEGGFQRPFSIDADIGKSPDGKFGFVSKLWVIRKNIKFGLFYTRNNFEKIDSGVYGFSLKFRF